MPDHKTPCHHSTISIKKVSDLEDLHLDQVIEIQRTCQLSRWSKDDYRDESNRQDSVFLTALSRVPGQVEITEIIGFILFRVNDIGETKVGSGGFSKEADLLNFGVTSKFQKQGIGNSMFEKARLFLADLNVNAIWLEVRYSNESAIKFYEKKGFRTVQIRKNFYSYPVENAVLMKLEL